MRHAHAEPVSTSIRRVTGELFPAVVEQLVVEQLVSRTKGGAASPAALARLHDEACARVLASLCDACAAQRGMPSGVFRGDSIANTQPLRLPPIEPLPLAQLGSVHELLMGLRLVRRRGKVVVVPDERRRRQGGVYYTPRHVVEQVVGETLQPALDLALAAPRTPRDMLASVLRLRVLDPAVGCGAFLLAAAEAIVARLEAATGEHAPGDLRRRVVASCLFGSDIDPLAIRLTRAVLRLFAGDAGTPALDEHVRRADALRQACEPRQRAATFDAVLGNPPYVDSTSLTKTDPRLRDLVRAHFAAARGNWDLYIPFVELAFRLVKLDGHVGLVTPGRLLAADYAAPAQAMLLERTLRSCTEYSATNLFSGAALPVVATITKNTPSRGDERVQFVRVGADRRVLQRRSATITELRELPPGFIGAPLRLPGGIRLQSLARLPTLATLADCSDGATTAEAYTLRDLWRAAPKDQRPSTRRIKLVNTGTIDPFQLRWADRPTRYLGRTLDRPVASSARLRHAVPRRWAQARVVKVVVAGLSRRLEAAVAPSGVMCGKSAVLVIPHAGVCPHALAAVLNSSWATTVYHGLFGLRGFSAESMAVGPRQLERLPMPPPAWLGPSTLVNPEKALKSATFDEWEELADRGVLSWLGRQQDARGPRERWRQITDHLLAAAEHAAAPTGRQTQVNP